MVAGVYDIYIEQGATYDLIVTWNDDLDEPYDLTDCVARMQIRQAYGTPILVSITTTSTSSGLITLGGVLGTITIKITDTATDTLTGTSALYDLEVQFDNDDVKRVLQGAVTISPNITRT